MKYLKKKKRRRGFDQIISIIAGGLRKSGYTNDKRCVVTREKIKETRMRVVAQQKKEKVARVWP